MNFEETSYISTVRKNDQKKFHIFGKDFSVKKSEKKNSKKNNFLIFFEKKNTVFFLFFSKFPQILEFQMWIFGRKFGRSAKNFGRKYSFSQYFYQKHFE